MKPTTQQKCQEILLKIVDKCNASRPTIDEVMGSASISFHRDFGGMTLTVCTPGTHAHVGSVDFGTFEELVDDLHELFHDERL